jgi:hypothetical protein
MEVSSIKISKEEQALIINDVLLEHVDRPRGIADSRGVIVTKEAKLKGHNHPVTIEYKPGNDSSTIRVRLKSCISFTVEIPGADLDEYKIRQSAINAYIQAVQQLNKWNSLWERQSLMRVVLRAANPILLQRFISSHSNANSESSTHITKGLLRVTGWKVTTAIKITENIVSFSIQLGGGRGSYKTDILLRFATEEVIREYAEHAFAKLLEQNDWKPEN